MKWIYHRGYQVALPAHHPFPMSKFALLRERLLRDGTVLPEDFLQPEPLDRHTLELIHTRDYLDKLESSTLSKVEERRLGLPWSRSLWLRSLLACGGTLLAARAALGEGVSGNLAGGTHHAFADHGEGFCVLNDVALAIAKLRLERAIDRALVIDLDVHQGNGTAAIFEGVEEVFTFSMHGEHNYPNVKMRSDLDVGLQNGTGDSDYLSVLEQNLPDVLGRARPDLVFYLAGVDVAAGDRYGKLSLSEEAIRLRDCRVVHAVRSLGLPLVIVLGGGYAASRERTAELHRHVFREAVKFERGTDRSNQKEFVAEWRAQFPDDAVAGTGEPNSRGHTTAQ